MTRLENLRSKLAEERLDVLLVTQMSDVAYLSGFRGSSGALLVGPEAALLATDFRYFTQAVEQAPGWELLRQPSGQSLIVLLGETLKERGCARIGFDGGQLMFASWEKLGDTLDGSGELISTNGLVAGLREVKEPGEVERIRQAAALADAAVEHACEILRPGMTERELKAEIDYFMVRHGAEKPSFDCIVASGPNSALPHAPVGERPVQRGDLLTIDLGATVDGYCSDLTRTYAVGFANADQQVIYDLVYRAQMAALAAVRPGPEGKDIDQVARDIIAAAGHEEHFGHGLGHGVGMDIHEGPRLASTGTSKLVPGNVVTVEPGVYVEGLGGVRIEDLVLVTEDGCEILSGAEKPAELPVI